MDVNFVLSALSPGARQRSRHCHRECDPTSTRRACINALPVTMRSMNDMYSGGGQNIPDSFRDCSARDALFFQHARTFLRCPECGLVFAAFAEELDDESGEPRVVECGTCLHMWFADAEDVLEGSRAARDDSAARLAARRRKRPCTQLVPADPFELRAYNLSPQTTPGILKKVFGAYGRVLRCEMMPASVVGEAEGSRSARVEMSSETEAREAIDGLNGVNIFGSQMVVHAMDSHLYSDMFAPELSVLDQYDGVIDDEVLGESDRHHSSKSRVKGGFAGRSKALQGERAGDERSKPSWRHARPDHRYKKVRDGDVSVDDEPLDDAADSDSGEAAASYIHSTHLHDVRFVVDEEDDDDVDDAEIVDESVDRYNVYDSDADDDDTDDDGEYDDGSRSGFPAKPAPRNGNGEAWTYSTKLRRPYFRSAASSNGGMSSPSSPSVPSPLPPSSSSPSPPTQFNRRRSRYDHPTRKADAAERRGDGAPDFRA